MSRIGKRIVNIPSDVDLKVDKSVITVKGPNGSLKKEFDLRGLTTLVTKETFAVSLVEEFAKPMWGTVVSIVQNMVDGVVKPFKKELYLEGVGFKSSIKDDLLNLSLGKSHNIKIEIPKSVSLEVSKTGLEIVASSIDKESLGLFVAVIKRQYKVDPYKGKGIHEKGAYIERKVGKK